MPEGAVAFYDRQGREYARNRQADPRIAGAVLAALAGSRTVVNVGAGAGSYEPEDRYVLAVEPSRAMRSQRPASLAPAVDARAEALPLDDDGVDAALAVLTVHHWSDQERGLREMRRVARGPVVVLTFDPAVKRRFWLWQEYVPEIAERDAGIFAAPDEILEALGGGVRRAIPIPFDCRDGFGEAYWGRPESYLRASARQAQSGWGHLPPGTEARAVRALAADLRAGVWDERHGHLRTDARFDAGLRLLVSPGSPD